MIPYEIVGMEVTPVLQGIFFDNATGTLLIGNQGDNSSSLLRCASIDIDKQNSHLCCLTVNSSVDRTLAWRSSGENASLFRALPLYSFNDAPSPLTDVRSPCQFDCMPFCQPSGLVPAGVLSLQPDPMTGFLNSLL